MYIAKTAKQYIILFYGMILAGGILHELLYGVPYTYEVSRMIYFGLIVAWTLTVRLRITDRICRKLMLAIAYLFMFFIILQESDYAWCYPFDNISYWLKQLFYIPMVLMALTSYYLALCAAEPSDRQHELLKKKLWVAAVAAVILLFILTNDFHRLFYDYSVPRYESVDNHTYEWGFFVYCGFLAALFAASIVKLVKKTRHTIPAKWAAVSLIPPAIGIFLVAKSSLGFRIFPWSHGFFKVGESFGIVIFGLIEAMIQIGMIPSNSGYDEFFAGTGVNACISDDSGKTVYQTKSFSLLQPAALPKPGDVIFDGEDTRLVTKKLSAGSVTWADDLSEINRLNLQLDLANVRLKEENLLIENENRLKEEKSILETSARLYDAIGRAVAVQSEKIAGILENVENAPSDEQKKALARAAFLTAYIKRRGNMELLAENSEVFDASELFLAVNETLDYLKLLGIETAVIRNPAGLYPARDVIFTYELFEAFTECCIEDRSAAGGIMASFMAAGDGALQLRVMASSGGDPKDIEGKARETLTHLGKDRENPVSWTVFSEEDTVILAVEIWGGGRND